jgi:alkylation response protein AidB-like acyl-CoA dehydrogenase
MLLSLTPSQDQFREKAQGTAREVCAPGAAERDTTSSFPEKELRSLGGGGWLGMLVAEGAGGSGIDELSAALSVTEFSRACASIGLLIGFHNFLVCSCLDRHGTEEMKTTYLPKLASGEMLGAVALSDPATADEGVKPACAVLTEQGILIRGTKRFVVGAAGAGLFLLYAATECVEQDHPRARMLLVVPRETPGLSISAPDPLVGVRATGTASLRFDDCVVPVSMSIGAAGEGRKIGKELLAAADLVVAAQAVGIGTAAMEKAVERAREREADGAFVGSRQSVQFMIAEMQVQLSASRLFVQRAVDARGRGSCAYQAAQAKTFAGRAAVEIADLAIQILGGDGSLADHGIERHWRDAKTCELNPSTREVAHLLVARHLLEERS